MQSDSRCIASLSTGVVEGVFLECARFIFSGISPVASPGSWIDHKVPNIFSNSGGRGAPVGYGPLMSLLHRKFQYARGVPFRHNFHCHGLQIFPGVFGVASSALGIMHP